jgi:hypothetical protein
MSDGGCVMEWIDGKGKGYLFIHCFHCVCALMLEGCMRVYVYWIGLEIQKGSRNRDWAREGKGRADLRSCLHVQASTVCMRTSGAVVCM